MPEGRIAKALRLLRIDRNSDPIELADALWLASQLPAPAREPRKPKPKAAAADGKDDRRNKGAANQTEPPPPPSSVSPAPTPDDPDKLFAPVRARPRESADRATYVKVAAGRALPQRLEIERALKPFLRRFFSRRLNVLDEQATAERSAEERRIEPMFRPAPERWFDVAIVAEDSAEMRVWADTLRQLDALMQRHGAFRQVRTFQYRVAGGRVELANRYGQPVQPKFLTDPENRRLCLVVTNGADSSWRQPALTGFVRDLGRNNVVAILQMLPRRLWPHTALGDAVDWVYSKEPGTPNRKLWVQDPFGGPDTRVPDADYAPVLTLEPEELKQWAQFVQSPRRVMSNAVLLSARGAAPTEPRPEATAEAMVREFRGIASPQAFRLLRLSAAALPLTVPVMRLLQEGISGGQQTVHLAEVLFSGLIRRETEDDAEKPLDEVYFEFASGVRDLLLDTLSSGEQKQAEEALEPARERIGKYLAEKIGISDIRVLLRDKEGAERLPESARAFLEVNRRVLERLRPPPVEKPRTAGVTAMQFSSDGRWLVVGRDNGQVELWAERRFARSASGNARRITAIAGNEAAGLVAAGTSTGAILIWELATGKPLWDFQAADISITTIDVTSGGAVFVHLADGRLGEFHAVGRRFDVHRTLPASPATRVWGFGGAEFLLADERSLRIVPTVKWRPDRVIAYFSRGTDIAAVSPDGFLVFEEWSELHVYQVLEDRLSPRLARIRIPEHRAVALSPGGRAVAYVALDGSIGFIEISHEKPVRKAHAPRNVVFIRGEDVDLSRAIIDDIADAGHKLVRDANIADWLVVQRPAAPHPLIDEWVHTEREVIYIGGVDEIAHALDAIDLPPLGPLVDFEPPILNDIPRPELEESIAKLYLDPPGDRLQIYFPSYSSAHNVLARVSRRPNVREFYAGGIYRGAEKLPKRPGRQLLLFPRISVRLGPGSLQVRAIGQTGQHDLEIGNVTDAEANSYILQAASLPLTERRLEKLKLYHQNVPRLVCLCAGLQKRFHADWLPATRETGVKRKYELGVAAIVGSLAAPLRQFLVTHAVMGPNPPAHLARAFGGDELREIAASCRWLYASPGAPALPLLSTARQAIKRVAGNEAAAHELIVNYFENPKDDLEAHFQDHYWSEHLIAHAAAAGRAPRVEKLLRWRHVLDRFLCLPPAEFRAQILGFRSRNRFLANLNKELTERIRSGAEAPDAAEQIRRIDDTVRSEASKPRWPKSSGVAAAHTAGVWGKGIEILLIADGCDLSHPELTGAEIAAAVHGPLGTAAASIIVGRNLGIAPRAHLVVEQSYDALTRRTEVADIVVFANSYAGRPDWTGLLEQTAAAGSLIIGPYGAIEKGAQLLLPVRSISVLAAGVADFQNRSQHRRRSAIIDGAKRLLPDVYGYGINVPVAAMGGEYERSSGPAFAAAYVAGIAALVAERTGLRGPQLRVALEWSAKRNSGVVGYFMR